MHCNASSLVSRGKIARSHAYTPECFDVLTIEMTLLSRRSYKVAESTNSFDSHMFLRRCGCMQAFLGE